ncbi:MAG: DUF2197 domain-containing protein [Candidatus Pacebacteria bacterium]|nr:DUF2197 domain-containing protein [Candidatus Paceibacterota bacterium]MBP9780635.1 DUF2197 domain-containing protein [Candidatus Paceibacterota bacterium]
MTNYESTCSSEAKRLRNKSIKLFFCQNFKNQTQII